MKKIVKFEFSIYELDDSAQLDAFETIRLHVK